MDFLINKKVAQPIPHEIDWNEAIKLMAWLISGIVIFFKGCDAYFKNKAKEKEDFITKVADAAVKAAMDGVLKDVRSDISVLFEYREADRKHIDTKFDNIMLEMRK